MLARRHLHLILVQSLMSGPPAESFGPLVIEFHFHGPFSRAPRHNGVGKVLGSSDVRLGITPQYTYKQYFL